jgi:hypothetical protein
LNPIRDLNKAPGASCVHQPGIAALPGMKIAFQDFTPLRLSDYNFKTL